MKILEGIVLKERSVGEQDKFIDILTQDSGVLEISVKGAKKINGKSASSAQLFAYSKFCVQQRRDQLYLNSSEPIHIFYGLRDSLTGLSLASYFADMLRFCCTENYSGNGDVMRLFLNTLHYLEKKSRSEAMLKSIFELRLLSEIGFMPDIVACRSCGLYEPEELFFSISEGCFYCSDCFSAVHDNVHGNESDSDYFKMQLPVLTAIRHIVLSDFDRLFNFRLSDKAQSQLSEISEEYMKTHLERSFNTLDFYKSLILNR